MSALACAVPDPKLDDCTVVVTDHLNLDVTWSPHEPFRVHRPVSERRLRLRPSTLVLVFKFLGALDDPHPAATASSRGLQEDRETGSLRERLDVIEGDVLANSAVDDGYTELQRQLAAEHLVAHLPNDLSAR